MKRNEIIKNIKEGFGDISFEVDGWKYNAEEEDYGDALKIHHSAISPKGEEVSIDFSPYQTMTKDLFKAWLDLGMPTRKDIGSNAPLNSDAIKSLLTQEENLEEMNPTNQQPGKIKQITGNEVEIENPDGTKLTAPAARLIKDPTTGQLKLGQPTAVPGQPNQPTDPAAKQDMPKAGDQVKMASEEFESIIKLAGLK
jgi:hypothetical protein